jgi:dTDP-4-dehydrorhamnose 3,5-epimerase
MIFGVIIKPIKKNFDDRGWLAEFFRNDEVDFVPAMSYFSYSKFGAVRGPHEHTYQSDYFVFVGPGDFELHLWDRRDNSETKDEFMKIVVGDSNPCFAIIPPGVVHGYKSVSEGGAFSINLPDKLYKGVNKQDQEVDEIRWEKDENSPYKIQ